MSAWLSDVGGARTKLAVACARCQAGLLRRSLGRPLPSPLPPTRAESLINVDGWNDVVASARSIMYSMPDPATIFDVYWFSNDVQKIGTATGEEVARSNAFARKVTNTVPKA